MKSPASSPSQDWHVGPSDLIQQGASLTKCRHHCKDTLTTPGAPPNPVLLFLGGGICLCWILKPPLSSGHSMMTGGDTLVSCVKLEATGSKGGDEARSESIQGSVSLGLVLMPADPGGGRKTHAIFASNFTTSWAFFFPTILFNK